MLLRRTRLPVLLALAIGWLSACGSEDGAAPTGQSSEQESIAVPSVQAVDGPESRLALTYDGGILVVRAEDGEVLADLPQEGFLRINPAGDDRHAFVSAPGGFTALDLGVWTVDHGDHGHSYADDPELTDYVVPAEEPGHVVVHDGTTTLFDDGTGTATALPTHQLAELDDEEPTLETLAADAAHHGVAVRGEGWWLSTVGTVEERSGVRLTDDDGAVLAETDQCPGVHGEAYAGQTAVFGCEDGVVVLDGERVAKVDAPDAYGRIGNLAGAEESAYVLGDYKVDPDAELERPTRVSVIDTEEASLELVDLGTTYSFRSLGRTAAGDGLVLGADGALHRIDVERGEVSASLPVVGAWEEPLDWEQPRPTLEVVGDTAYVTEPATQSLHVVDLASMSVVATHALPQVPNELVAVAG